MYLLIVDVTVRGPRIEGGDVEATFEKHFAFANQWGYILLLDEADIFLASRTTTDHLRNSSVSGESLNALN